MTTKTFTREKDIYKTTLWGSVVNFILLTLKFIAGFVGKASAGTTIVIDSCHGTGTVVAKDYVAGLSVYTDTTTKTNKGSCITGSVACSGTNKNASYIK